MFRATTVIGGQKIGKLFAPLGKTALDDGGEAFALGGSDQRLNARRQLHGNRFDLGRRIKNRAGQRADDGHVVSRLDQNRERAVGLVSRLAGEALAHFFLDEKKKARRIARQAEAFHQKRGRNIVGEIAADDGGCVSKLGNHLQRVALAQIEVSPGELRTEMFPKKNTEAAIFFQGDEMKIFFEEDGGERSETGADLDDVRARGDARDGMFGQPPRQILIVKKILSELLERA